MMEVFKAQYLLTVALLCAAAHLATFAAGQGFQASDKTPVGVTQSYAQYQQLYSRSKAYKRLYKLNSAAACSNRGSGNLCAAAAAANITDAFAQLLLAASPQVYSSTDAEYTGGLWLVSPPMNQQTCDTCSAFAVASTAETAMASALGVSVSECSISVQALHFCPPGDRPGRYCRGGVALDSVLDLLTESASELLTSKCMSYEPDVFNRPGAEDLCSSSCDTPNQHAADGRFAYKPLTTMWEAQLHIRQIGAVVTRFDVMDDFRAFFDKPANAKAVYKPNPKAQYALGHAVVLVGYNNEEQYWIAKNSWGVGWGDFGYFKVAYGTCAIFTADGQAYGVTWTPKGLPAARLLPLVPGPRAGCYLYQTRPGDYMTKIALSAGVPLNKFVEDNADTVRDLDAPLEGKQLYVCNPKPGNFIVMQAKLPAMNRSQGEVSDPQLESLLQIKAAIDTQGILREWSRGSGKGAGYCNWRGVQCGDKMVVNITFGINSRTLTPAWNLHGTLPLVSAFSGLKFLRVLEIRSPSVIGTLPEDWFQLTQLEELHLGNFYAQSSRSTIPAAWGKLTRLKVLRLSGSFISGEIPETFRALQKLETLDLTGLLFLSGTIPAWLGTFTRLRELRMAYCDGLKGFIPNTLAALTSLEVLDLTMSKVNGPIPPWLGKFRQLRSLRLDSCGLTGSIPSSLSALSKLELLALDFNELTGTTPPGFGDLRHLRYLSLSGPLSAMLMLYNSPNNPVSTMGGLRGTIPATLSNLKNLSSLGLSANKLTGPLPPSFSDMQLLKSISLSNNNLSGPVPSSWSQLTSLREVGLNNNPNLKGCVPKAWNRKCPGCIIEYHNTGIKGYCPSQSQMSRVSVRGYVQCLCTL